VEKTEVAIELRVLVSEIMEGSKSVPSAMATGEIRRLKVHDHGGLGSYRSRIQTL
jgi:hypothetical protein